MVLAQRLCVPVLCFLQDAKQMRILFRCSKHLKNTVIKQTKVFPLRQYSVKYCAISSPVGSQIGAPRHQLNKHVVTKNVKQISKGDNDRTRRTTNSNFVVYAEKENEYFHNYLSNTDQYKPLFFSGCRNDNDNGFISWERLSDELGTLLNLESSELKISQNQLLSVLKNVSSLPVEQHMNLFHDSNFHKFCKCLLSQLSNMSNEDYLDSMAALSRLSFRQCITSDLRDIRIMIAQSFDEENMKRMTNWQARQLLLVADFYFHLRCSSSVWVRYLKRMFSTVFASRTFSELGKEEIVTLLLHVGLTRQIGERDLNEALLKICQQIDTYTIEELGIVSLAYFKTNKPVRNTLFQKELAAKLNSCVSEAGQICLSAVLKCLQKSSNKLRIRYHPELLQQMIELQPSLSLRMPSLTPQTALHVLSIFHSFKYISEQLISSFSVKLARDHLKEWRLKDLALAVRLLADLSECFPNKTEILARLTRELGLCCRESEVESHLDYLARCLLGMAMAGVYSEPLLRWLFKTESLDYFTGHSLNLYRDLYQLSESVRIECAAYSGPLLPDHLVIAQSKKSYICGRLPRIADRLGDENMLTLSKRDEMMERCVEALDWVLAGQRHLHVHFLLPHYQTADIELCNPSSGWKSKNGELLSDAADSDVCDSNQRIAVLVYSENAYYNLIRFDGSVHLVLRGNYAMKRRQLRHLGFRIIEIPFYEFNPLETKKKYDYVLNKLKLSKVISKDHENKLVLPKE